MKFLILRRISQILILGLFFASNYYGVKILQGNLSSSLLFGVLPLSDPFAVLQLFLASFNIPAATRSGQLRSPRLQRVVHEVESTEGASLSVQFEIGRAHV